MILIALLATNYAFVVTVLLLLANGMRSSPGKFAGRSTILAAWLAAGVLWAAFAIDEARGADLRLAPLPPEVTLGYSYDRPIGLFGTYSTHYLQRRWARMCKGSQRYDAMRESFELGKGNPCR